jgi:hypothetical protein
MEQERATPVALAAARTKTALRTKIVLLTLAAMLAALLVATGARATYPGANGRLAFVGGRQADQLVRRHVTGPGVGTVEIWKMKQNGKDQEQVTHICDPSGDQAG